MNLLEAEKASLQGIHPGVESLQHVGIELGLAVIPEQPNPLGEGRIR